MTPQNQLHSPLLKWYDSNKRMLPWRLTNNPYKVWLSEIILQQTRVSQGIPYYEKFVDKYPTVRQLASADESAILKMWQGLGYYSRARNMHKAAKIVDASMGGVFPQSAKELKKLPGIGHYTSAAIASICYQEPVAVLDGNVYRVLSRLYAVEVEINSSQGTKIFSQLAQHLLNHNSPGDHNQAMMELGANICLPTNPKCLSCPLNIQCIALQSNTVASFPRKHKKPAKRIRHFNYLVFESQSIFLLEQRIDSDIWKHLYQFPMIETAHAVSDFRQLEPEIQRDERMSFVGAFKIEPPTLLQQTLTHQKIQAHFWKIHAPDIKIGDNSPVFKAHFDEIQAKFAVPVVIKKYLSALNL